MNMTNKLRLPDAIVRAIANDSYTKGDADISVTELLLPPQLRRLKLQHAAELVEDVSDRIYSLLGQTAHTIIERAAANDAGVLVEASLYSKYAGWLVKGQADHLLLATGELLDFKLTSVYKVKGGQVPREWIEQTNIYRRLLQKEKGVTVNSVAIIVLLRDWSRNEARRTQDYPQAQVVRLDVPLWEADRTDAFIEERIRLHQAEVPQPCDDYDVWAKPDSWAVMKRGNVKAVRVFKTMMEAEDFAKSSVAYYVEHRPGIAIRCQDWCPVSQFCQQWQADPRNKHAHTELSVTETLFNA